MKNEYTLNDCKELITEVLTYERLTYSSQLALEQCLKILSELTKAE